MPTRIRIKLDYVIEVATEPLDTAIPMIDGPRTNDLIVHGLVKVFPHATAVLPGTKIMLHNIDFVKALRAKNKEAKRAAKAAARRAPETVAGTPLAPGRSTAGARTEHGDFRAKEASTMRARDYERLVKQHAAMPLHDGFAVCSCELAQRLKAEAVRRADLLATPPQPHRYPSAANMRKPGNVG